MKAGTLKTRGFHAMLYGPPGIMKTTLACQFPRPLLLLDVEGAAGWLDPDVSRLVDEIKTPSEGVSLTQDITNELLSASRQNRFATVVIDSLSNARLRELDRMAGGIMPAQGDYGLFNAWLGRILYQSQFFPQIILWLAASEENVDGQRRLIQPGGMSENNVILCNQLLDAIIYAGWRQKPGGAVTRYLTVAPSEPFGGRSAILVKDRTGLLRQNPTVEVPDREPGRPMPSLVEFFQPVFDRIAAERGAAPARKEGAHPAAKPARPTAPPGIRR